MAKGEPVQVTASVADPVVRRLSRPLEDPEPTPVAPVDPVVGPAVDPADPEPTQAEEPPEAAESYGQSEVQSAVQSAEEVVAEVAQDIELAGDEEEEVKEGEEEEVEEETERLMGLEAMQFVRRDPTPPPSSCSQRSGDFGELPICEIQDEILKQVKENRVTTIIGGTGCGKSTQVPQFIIRDAAARQEPCSVMVTQPRRLAATSLARRCAEELGLTMGVEVGYRIRGETVPGEHLSFATAGYLLSWLMVDPDGVKSMTHLILDEAHIRSTDMELLLLMMRLVMRINSHLRVILMSVTGTPWHPFSSCC